MQSKDYNFVSPIQESFPTKPGAYSNYFKFRLRRKDFGKSRENHNAICNAQLLAHLEELTKDEVELYEEVSNANLIESIKNNPHNPPHDTLSWHHCHSSTVMGEIGVMHLVSKKQHNSKDFGKLFHPSKQGGYHEWAVPMGAPVDKKGFPSNVPKKAIQTVQANQLAPAFLAAVGANNQKKFNLLLARAKELTLSEKALTDLITQIYEVGLRKRPEYLLHIASAHGNMALIEPLLFYFTKHENFPQLVNSKGNTAAHNAAKNNRAIALEKLKAQGINLSIKNKRNETVHSIVQARNSAAELPSYQPKVRASESDISQQENIAEQKQKHFANLNRDPHYLYSDVSKPRQTYRERSNLQPLPEAERERVKNNSCIPETSTNRLPRSPISSSSEPRKTYRERMGLPPLTEAERERIKNNLCIQETPTNTVSSEPRKTYRERMGLPPLTEAERERIKNNLCIQETPTNTVSSEPRKTYRERMGLPPLTEAERERVKNNLCIQETPLSSSSEPRKTYRERIGLKPLTEAERESVKNNQIIQGTTNRKLPLSPLLSSKEPRKTYSERIGLTKTAK